MAELPLGCKFSPSDAETFTYSDYKVKFSPSDAEIFTYLDNKVNHGKQPNVNLGLVKELDLYQCCPHDHRGLSKEECTYIFATRVRKYNRGKHSNRKTRDGKGCWKISRAVKFEEGTKKFLTYYLKSENSSGEKEKPTDWKMQEYELKPADDAEAKRVNETTVLCQITNRNQQNTAAPANEEIVFTELGSEGAENQQNAFMSNV